jgi:hypothetical protein
VNQDDGEAGGTEGLKLPIQVAKNAAAVERVNEDGIFLGGNSERRPGIEIADNGLEMAV